MDTSNVNTFLVNADVLLTVIPALFSLAGVIIGSMLSNRSVKRQTEKRFLIDFYAEVFLAYANWVALQNINTTAELMAAIEKVRLFCSPESNRLLEQLEYEITEHQPNTKTCGQITSELRKAAKKDVHKS